MQEWHFAKKGDVRRREREEKEAETSREKGKERKRREKKGETQQTLSINHLNS
jgi:hypothetical protein